MKYSIIHEHVFWTDLQKYSIYMAVYNILPFSYKGFKSDGKQVIDILGGYLAP